MKKILKRLNIIVLMLSICILSACSSGNTKKIEGKIFNGMMGGQILVLENKLHFSGKPFITPNTTPDDIEKNKDKVEKAETKEFKNPKIINENGKEFLTADGFKYKLQIVDDNKIIDIDDNYEYTYVDLNKK